MAVDAACGAAITSADVVARAKLVADTKGIVESIDFPSYVVQGRQSSIKCLVVTRGGPGLEPYRPACVAMPRSTGTRSTPRPNAITLKPPSARGSMRRTTDARASR